jgi:hypothetical protein
MRTAKPLELGRRVREACAPIADELAAKNLDPAAVVAEFIAVNQTLRGPNAPALLEHLRQTFSIPVAILPLPRRIT